MENKEAILKEFKKVAELSSVDYYPPTWLLETISKMMENSFYSGKTDGNSFNDYLKSLEDGR